MIFILTFLFIIVFLEIFILGVIFSLIIINIEDIEIKFINNKIFLDRIKISVNIKIFKCLEIIKIKFYKEYLKIFGLKFYYKKILKYENNEELYRNIFKIFKENENKIKNKKITPELDFFKFDLNFGTENVIITSMLTVTLSGIITIIFRKFIKKFNKEKYYFKIMPNYFNTNNFSFKFTSKIKLKTIELV